MITHIVMWRLHDRANGQTKAANAIEMKSRLEALRASIPVIRRIEVGVNVVQSDTCSDVVLYSEFDSLDDLQAYAQHPDHLAVVGFVKAVTCERRAVDYLC